MKNKQSGFTIIELLLVIIIIGILSSTLVPLLKTKNPRYERKLFLARLNALMQLAWQRAVVMNSVIRVMFDVSKKTIVLEQQVQQTGKAEPSFTPIKQSYISSSLLIPSSLLIKKFFIEGSNEMDRVDKNTAQVWFYIVPRGLAQQVEINAIDISNIKNKKTEFFNIRINPFTGRFAEYEVSN